jgi:uncharacterized OsmC-like protein
MALNNVNAERMKGFVEEVKRDPKVAEKHKTVEGTWVFQEGKPQFVAELPYEKGKAEVACELPPFAGGWGTSPDPIQYCLYGLAACFAATFVATAVSEGIALRSLKVTAENWVDLRKQLGLSKDDIIKRVKLTVKVEADADREELEKLMGLAEERCPGTECVTRSIPFEAVLS